MGKKSNKELRRLSGCSGETDSFDKLREELGCKKSTWEELERSNTQVKGYAPRLRVHNFKPSES